METSVLQQIQTELKAPKSQYNSFGKYNYRSCEDIQEALKPILGKYGCSMVIADKIMNIADRVYVEATIRLLDAALTEIVTTTGYAREPQMRKGMDEAQVTGATSSYARKYALGGMFLLDDTKDADSMDKPEPKKTPIKQPAKKETPPAPFADMLTKFATAKGVLNKKTGDDSIYYSGLETLGFKHANKIKKVSDGNKLLAEFRTFLTPKKEEKEEEIPY